MQSCILTLRYSGIIIGTYVVDQRNGTLFDNLSVEFRRLLKRL